MSASKEKLFEPNILRREDSSPLSLPKNIDNLKDKIDQNLEQINYVYSIFEYALLSASFSFLSLLLCIFVNSMYEVPFYVFSLFGFIIIISSGLLANLYIKLKILLDTSKGSNKPMNTTVIISYACFNLAFFNSAIYLVLLTIRQEILAKAFPSSALVVKNLGELESSLSMTTISIPLFIAFALIIFFFLFMLPVLLHTEMWLDIMLYGLGIVCSLTFVILLNLKVDKDLNNWLVVSTPMITLFAYCIIYTVLSHMSNTEEKGKKIVLIGQVLSWVMIISGLMIYFMDKDKFIVCKSYFSLAFILIGTGILTILKLLELFGYEDTNHKPLDEESIKV